MAAVTSAGRATGFEPFELPADSGAAATLYERHAGRVFGYCLSRLGRREDAEDAVQTTFLHAVRSLRRGVVPLVESAWLLGIARNVCFERWEAAGRRNRIEAVCDPVELERASAAPQGPRDELFGLEEALARLPEQQRRAVLLRDWRGLSYDEVAAQLGVSRAAVETLIFRGRRTLAGQLREGTQETRRRLASLANLGSLFTAVKGALTGAAAATKLAVAVTVTVVGAGVAITASTPGDAAETPGIRLVPSRATQPQTAARVPERAQSASLPAVPARALRARAGTRPAGAAPAKAGGRVQARATGATAAARPTAVPAPANEPAAPAPMPGASAPPRSVVIVPPAPKLAPVTAPVEKAADGIVANAPVLLETVTEPVGGVTEPVGEAAETVTAAATELVSDAEETLPPVTVTTPEVGPVPPATVTVPKLLP